MDDVTIIVKLTKAQAEHYVNFDWRRVIASKLFYDAVKKALG